MANPYLKKFKDRQLMSRLKHRDREAFILAYDENIEEINRFVYFKVGNIEEANDLTSLIFLKAWNHVQNKNLLEAKTLRALLYTIARNAIIDYYREEGSKKSLSMDAMLDKEGEFKDPQGFLFPDEKNKPDNMNEKIDKQSELDMIKEKLGHLKEEYREIIIMRFINDLSMDEIVNITKKTKGNIRVSLHRALKALKELVDEEEKARAEYLKKKDDESGEGKDPEKKTKEKKKS